MKLKVENDVVRKNVELFKLLLKRISQQTNSNAELKEKTYDAFIHKVKGEIHFKGVSPETKELAKAKDWKHIVFKVYVDMNNKEKLSCSVTEGDDKILQWDDLKEAAYIVLKETIKTIQLISRVLPRIENLPRLYLEFSQINLSNLDKERGGKDLIHEAWHQIDRKQTETILKNMEVGTYLFRKDEYAALLEQELSGAFNYAIKCITLSYLDNSEKVCDLTIVKTEDGWLIYNNDPNLREPTYPTSSHLFETLSGVLKTPLLH